MVGSYTIADIKAKFQSLDRPVQRVFSVKDGAWTFHCDGTIVQSYWLLHVPIRELQVVIPLPEVISRFICEQQQQQAP